MLTIHAAEDREPQIWRPGAPSHGAWFDLCDPDRDEIDQAEAATGLTMWEREQLDTLGLARRNDDSGEGLHMRIALFAENGNEADSPLGIALNESVLVSMHDAKSPLVDETAARWRQSRDASAASAFAMLLESVINDVAAQMQKIAGDVARLSDEVFVEQRRRTPELHRMMIRVGRLEGRLARLRPCLLDLARTLGFVDNHAPVWLANDVCVRLKMVAGDLKTLEEFDDQLTGKLQFLLDAILGFISTAQNAVMKLLTVVSVVTIPPVILAGVWGMNFQHMPELQPVWGYPMALAVLLLSMVPPLLWFKARGWLGKD